MAKRDGTSQRRRDIEEGYAEHDIESSSGATNATLQWYLNHSRYPDRTGNHFTPYFSGEEVFKAVANSIQTAQESIEIITWGFDPAIPLVREGYHKYEEIDRNGRVHTYSPWERKDSYGDLLIQALYNNPKLKIRIVIWHFNLNQKVIGPNIVGLNGNYYHSSINATERDTGFSPEAFDNKAWFSHDLDKLPLRPRHPNAKDYSSEWFNALRWADVKKYPLLDRIAVAFRDIPAQPVEDEDDLYGLEDTLLKFPSDHQKMVLIDFEEDSNRHAYVMGHNSLTEYWSAFPFIHRDPRSEMDNRPYHDFSVRIEGPLTIDLNENFCEAWGKNRKGFMTVAEMPKNLPFNDAGKIGHVLSYLGEGLVKATTSSPPVRALEQENPAALLHKRKALYKKIESISKGDACGQIVRTRPDQRFNDGHQEKEIKDAYMQVTRHIRNYVLIVNQYCQYSKLIKHIKYWKDKAAQKGQTDNLYILMGTCKPERGNMVFRAHQMANEMGLSHQFTKTEDEMYDRKSEDADGNKKRTRSGKNMNASEKVPLKEMTDMGIFPLFFMFYTQIPGGPAEFRQNHVAQQVYVHAKLMIQDDVFFTMGSANLNVRSMASDSELNIISQDEKTAQDIRKRLFDTYSGMAGEQSFPNENGVLSQAQMKNIYDALTELTKKNLRKVKKEERIKGYITEFEDDRSVTGWFTFRMT